jgi:hypothetical protein
LKLIIFEKGFLGRLFWNDMYIYTLQRVYRFLEEKTCVATQKRRNGKKRKKRKKRSGKHGEESGEAVRVNRLAEVFLLLPFFHLQNARVRL